MKKRKLISIMLAAVMAVSLTACGGGSKSKEGGTTAQAQYVNTYFDSEPTTLDPSLRSDSYSNEILTNVMEGLIRIEQRDGKYEIMPGDAETWEPNEDESVWTFHLGKDRKWSDGEAVTADQYVYSLQRSSDPATGCPNSYFLAAILNYDAISTGEMPVEELGVKALDDYTLEITLKNPMPSFLESTDASIFYPQRQDIVEKYGDQFGTDADKMVYNGPFVVESWTHNSEIKISKNAEYWDKDNVSLDYVDYQILSDVSAVSNAYNSGQLDVLYASSSEEVAQLEADDNNVYTKISGGNITFAFYNTQDKLFSNVNVRKAFTLALDQEEVNEMGFDELREPLYGWIAPAISVDGTSMREVAGNPILEQKKAMEAEGKTAKDYLLEGMKELGLGDDPAALDVTFSLAGTDDWFHTFGEYLQQAYKEALGVEVKIDFSEWGIFSDNLANGNYQIGYMSWGAYFNDPYDMLSLHMSEFNQISTNWSNADYDALVKAGASEPDSEKRMQDYVDAEKILMDNYVVCPFATSVNHLFTKSYVHDKYAEYGEESLYFKHPGWKNVYVTDR